MSAAVMDSNILIEQLTAGFDALRDEYHKLHQQHQTLERKLATARDQYNELAKLCTTERTRTPPLSLTSAPASPTDKAVSPADTVRILENSQDTSSQEASRVIAVAVSARETFKRNKTSHSNGVKIWSGPSADHLEPCGSSMMPSISESPLEQDFTIEGKPSSLGCPFASMASRKLNSHAASVLSRYNGSHLHSGSDHPLSSNASRINGRDSVSQHRSSRQRSRRQSFIDPIKAEICGLSDHNSPSTIPQDQQAGEVTDGRAPTIPTEHAEAGVCPIRFLDQHSPEEVATYFEKHKHELPRSHEVCVMRYQSNEAQIRELDAKYGNIVSMIQGLGQKHKDLLPKEPDELGVDEDTAQSDEKVRKWASSVSVQQAGAGDDVEEQTAASDDDERQPHFERPLRDIRLGESPSRPWGIPVPAKYLETAENGSDRASSRPAQIPTPPHEEQILPAGHPAPIGGFPSGAKCPFGFSNNVTADTAKSVRSAAHQVVDIGGPETKPPRNEPAHPANVDSAPQPAMSSNPDTGKMVFNGPVFFGYSADDVATLLGGHGLKVA